MSKLRSDQAYNSRDSTSNMTNTTTQRIRKIIQKQKLDESFKSKVNLSQRINTVSNQSDSFFLNQNNGDRHIFKTFDACSSHKNKSSRYLEPSTGIKSIQINQVDDFSRNSPEKMKESDVFTLLMSPSTKNNSNNKFHSFIQSYRKEKKPQDTIQKQKQGFFLKKEKKRENYKNSSYRDRRFESKIREVRAEKQNKKSIKSGRSQCRASSILNTIYKDNEQESDQSKSQNSLHETLKCLKRRVSNNFKSRDNEKNISIQRDTHIDFEGFDFKKKIDSMRRSSPSLNKEKDVFKLNINLDRIKNSNPQIFEERESTTNRSLRSTIIDENYFNIKIAATYKEGCLKLERMLQKLSIKELVIQLIQVENNKKRVIGVQKMDEAINRIEESHRIENLYLSMMFLKRNNHKFDNYSRNFNFVDKIFQKFQSKIQERVLGDLRTYSTMKEQYFMSTMVSTLDLKIKNTIEDAFNSIKIKFNSHNLALNFISERLSNKKIVEKKSRKIAFGILVLYKNNRIQKEKSVQNGMIYLDELYSLSVKQKMLSGFYDIKNFTEKYKNLKILIEKQHKCYHSAKLLSYNKLKFFSKIQNALKLPYPTKNYKKKALKKYNQEQLYNMIIEKGLNILDCIVSEKKRRYLSLFNKIDSSFILPSTGQNNQFKSHIAILKKPTISFKKTLRKSYNSIRNSTESKYSEPRLEGVYKEEVHKKEVKKQLPIRVKYDAKDFKKGNLDNGWEYHTEDNQLDISQDFSRSLSRYLDVDAADVPKNRFQSSFISNFEPPQGLIALNDQTNLSFGKDSNLQYKKAKESPSEALETASFQDQCIDFGFYRLMDFFSRRRVRELKTSFLELKIKLMLNKR